MGPNPQETAVTFTVEILNGKLHFLCSVRTLSNIKDEAFVKKTHGFQLHLRCLTAKYASAIICLCSGTIYFNLPIDTDQNLDKKGVDFRISDRKYFT